MVFRIAGGLYLLCVGLSEFGFSLPSPFLPVLALIAGIALLAGL